MPGWIDYKKLKASTDIRDVLTHYNITLKEKGDQATGLCPLPKHEGEAKPSFSVKLSRGIFQCFGCGARGNVIDLVAYMEGLNPHARRDFREAAAKLQAIAGQNAPQTKRADKQKPKRSAQPRNVQINPTLDFHLKQLDANHPYLVDRGFTNEAIEFFGLGFCSRGYLKGRIAIPLHDAHKQLIGYAGRIVDDAAIDDENPKYLFPAARERDGVRLEFHKSLFVYNGNMITTPVDDLIVVEGFTSVWWLRQAGFRRVVAIMGSSCSNTQGGLIAEYARPGSLVRIMPDGDDAGERCALSLFEKVAPRRRVQWLRLEPGKQPTDQSPEALQAMRAMD